MFYIKLYTVLTQLGTKDEIHKKVLNTVIDQYGVRKQFIDKITKPQ